MEIPNLLRKPDLPNVEKMLTCIFDANILKKSVVLNNLSIIHFVINHKNEVNKILTSNDTFCFNLAYRSLSINDLDEYKFTQAEYNFWLQFLPFFFNLINNRIFVKQILKNAAILEEVLMELSEQNNLEILYLNQLYIKKTNE
uniref:Uncharacterized protein n=1 Tax=Cyanophora sudae TaxID=1522369 RepID=A0A2Z4HGA9_9EUKA|nr:hypothetical protein [Cyanophora sudae]YP_009504486.1 hypothetical protein [Cyanophora sudae]AWW13683.1 hypothetical protein [Cyanophora sudae]AWW13684.1 hypothetical protein [Cyanophora sudae]